MRGGDAFFIDSNLLLYFVDSTKPEKQTRAAEWLDALWENGAGRLSWQVLNEFYWNAVKKMRLKPTKAREIVEDLNHWGPVNMSLGVLHDAWLWMDTTQVPYWDALILAAARRSGSRYLLSEDFQGGRRYEEIEILNPFECSPGNFSL